MSAGRKRRGFTLIELLVAAVITLILVGVILGVTTGVLNLWRRTQGGFTANAEAKLALDLLERDLQAAVWRRDSNAWFAVSVVNDASGLANRGWLTTGAMTKPAGEESLRLLPDPGTDGEARLADARFGLSGAWLRFIATNVESSGSLPVATAYQIARRPLTGTVNTSNPAPLRYTLFRSVVRTADTFTNGYDIMSSSYGSTSNTPGSQRDASTIANPVNADALATNVIDMGAWLYVRETNGSLRRIFPATTGDVAHVARGNSTADASRMPEAADVMLRVLSEDGAAQIEAIETGRVTRPPQYATDAEWWWAVAEANSRVFVRRVELKGGAL